jgi:hypothetical protein
MDNSVDALDLMPTHAPQDSLRGLASVDVENDFPELQYVSPAERHTIEVDEKSTELEAEEPKSTFNSPLIGIAMISVLAGGFYVVTKGISN